MSQNQGWGQPGHQPQGYGPPGQGHGPPPAWQGAPPHGWPGGRPPPQPSKKGKYIAIGIACFIGLGMCRAVINGSSRDTTTAAEEPRATTAAATATTTPTAARDTANQPAASPVPTQAPPKVREPGLGEEFKLGSFTYTVKNVQLAGAVGSGFSRKSASEGAMFVLVNFTIRNDSNETETVMTDDFRIIDAQGRQYQPSSDANTALIMSTGKDLGITELHPGLKKSMTTAFEMPEESAKGVFTLVIPEKGLFGTGSVRITLK